MWRWIRPFFWAGVAVVLIWIFLTPRALPPKLDPVLRGEFLPVEGNLIYFQQKGEGRRVVLWLPGFSLHWDGSLTDLQKISPDFRVIILDFPGFGFSDKNISRLSPADLALRVKLFLDKLDIKEVDLVGHDLGGGVAMILAAEYPQLVKRMVLVSPDSSYGQSGAALPRWLRWPACGDAWAFLFLNRNWMRAWLQSGWVSPQAKWQEVVERYSYPLELPNARRGFLQILRGETDFRYQPYEERQSTPTLVLWGEQDPVIRSFRGRQLAAKIGATFQSLPGVGHFPLDEDSARTVSLVEQFLQNDPTLR